MMVGHQKVILRETSRDLPNSPRDGWLHVETGKNFADMVILNHLIKVSGVGRNQDLPEYDNDMEGDYEIVDEESNHTHRHHCSSTY